MGSIRVAGFELAVIRTARNKLKVFSGTEFALSTFKSGLVPEWVDRVTDRTADGDENE
jgi:hypothetical protein